MAGAEATLPLREDANRQVDTSMPATIRSEFSLALNQVATERGIDPSVVLETIKAAILAAFRKDYGSEDLEQLNVELNPDNGEAKILKDGKDVTPPGFGRIAAQTAKQVILQRIREAEKQAVLTDFQTKIGSIVTGMVLRFDGSNVIVEIGRTQAIMPQSEQNPQERYHLNQRLTFYVEGIRETMRGSEIIVSRAHKGLVEGLFKREVPEVAQGTVELRVVAREAGMRTKIAVFSSQSGVDPVGSCVGQKGVRVQAVITELGNNEKVDIIQWSENSKQFIASALAPAKDVEVVLLEDKKIAEVYVPEDQLSLAIGRDGGNVRLAAKLTGWKIDMKKKPEAESLGKEKTEKEEAGETVQEEKHQEEQVLEEHKKESEEKKGKELQSEAKPKAKPKKKKDAAKKVKVEENTVE
ncbi:MAG: NusA antitermination factor [Candidatus Gottesmanbacteria bacterium GW2011_GWB1_44_11c]|uniref:Transcription termination/antitermination protein NusA n=2 Tax=Candidatus Gottesmaniibacteriota TaxID=1752720 RepID=A0A0G1GMV3_9BACT|nr:MAG: NusA antitermination factor [Candidatus Gottesmanbacteria bacterium GW2011_GWB1_44_11c]